jgi:hypothetical protein
VSEQHCATCICGRRAPVQGDYPDEKRRAAEQGKPPHGPGTVSWEEHLLAWSAYAAHGHSQSAERLAQRGGFGYGEMTELLGHEPKTWRAGQ